MYKMIFLMTSLVFLLSMNGGNDSIKVTYIANSGCYIELGNKKLLIDAIFNNGLGNYHKPDSLTLAKIMNKQSPFEQLDYVLITHDHPDHVNDSLIVKLVDTRTDFKLLCPDQFYSKIEKQLNHLLVKNRIYPIKLDTAATTQLNFDDISFTIARSKHGPTYNIENLCYVIESNNSRVLHTGDAFPESMASIKLGIFKDLDLAIVPLAFGKDRFYLLDSVIQPKNTMVSHIKTGFEKRFEEIIKTDTLTFKTKKMLFKPMEEFLFN